MIALPVTNAANRLDPGPLPQDPNTTRIFTISPSAEPPLPYQPFSSGNEGLCNALGRISCYIDGTALRMVLYQHNGTGIVHISRETQVRQDHAHLEEAQYIFTLSEWMGLHPAKACHCTEQCEWAWWHNLTDLLNRSNDRASHSVQRQLRISGRPEEKILWRNLPIIIRTKTVPDSVLDDESLPFWERMELSVT